MFAGRVEIALGDIRQLETLPAVMSGITQLIACTGTTAFPSERWEFDLPSNLNGIQRISEWGKLYLNDKYRDAKAKNSRRSEYPA
jgi:hypothetical protein